MLSLCCLDGYFGIKWFTFTIVCVCGRFGEINDTSLTRHEGRGSEGFLEHILKHAAKELFGLDVNEIVYKTLR